MIYEFYECIIVRKVSHLDIRILAYFVQMGLISSIIETNSVFKKVKYT